MPPPPYITLRRPSLQQPRNQTNQPRFRRITSANLSNIPLLLLLFQLQLQLLPLRRGRSQVRLPSGENRPAEDRLRFRCLMIRVTDI